MDTHPILQFFSTYGYWIAVPLMIAEGPIVTIVMAFLASFGLFNIFVVIALGFSADMVSDYVFYWSGKGGGKWFLRFLKIPQVHENGELQKLKERFENHPGKVFFGAKVLTGVAQSVFVLSGMMKIPYPKILKYSIPGGLVWSSFLGVLGFYFGLYVTSINRLLSVTGIILFSLVILFLIYKFWLNKYFIRKFTAWRQRRNGNNHEQISKQVQEKDTPAD